MKKFTMEDVLEFTETACDLCASEKFLVVVEYQSTIPTRPNEIVHRICNNREEVFSVVLHNAPYGRGVTVFPW